MSKKFTKKQLKKMNAKNSSVKVHGGTIAIAESHAGSSVRRKRALKNDNGVIIVTGKKQTTKKDAKGLTWRD
ncbi:MAG: hypothetical protein MJ214_04955 [Bacilli bacterium]|nr:hypothetical protein [Bacilli bacterium]